MPTNLTSCVEKSMIISETLSYALSPTASLWEKHGMYGPAISDYRIAIQFTHMLLARTRNLFG